MINYDVIKKFYFGKRVLVTGNTGFKGSWLTKILLDMGAIVTGYSLKPSEGLCLYNLIKFDNKSNYTQVFADIRNMDDLKEAFIKSRPDIVIHLAAQPIVREGYRNPVDTYSTNVMGTVNICECVRLSNIPRDEGGLLYDNWNGVKSFLNVTTDKVYKNNEWEYGYREDELLDGSDPYSNSKSCSELVTHCYRNSYWSGERVKAVATSTARAGNVIGGGDFSKDRIIPDCVRAIIAKENRGLIKVRNPFSTRPYQHVLEPLFAYLIIVMKQYEDIKYSGYYNVGPDEVDCATTGELVEGFCKEWNSRDDKIQVNLSWNRNIEVDAPKEANFLKLDCSRIKNTFGWKPQWHLCDAIKQTVSWTMAWVLNEDIEAEMDKEINDYISIYNVNNGMRGTKG